MLFAQQIYYVNRHGERLNSLTSQFTLVCHFSATWLLYSVDAIEFHNSLSRLWNDSTLIHEHVWLQQTFFFLVLSTSIRGSKFLRISLIRWHHSLLFRRCVSMYELKDYRLQRKLITYFHYSNILLSCI